MEFPEGLFKKQYIKIPGFIKKGVEFQGIKKNSCGICMGAWFLVLDLGISKQQCTTILWNFQGWGFALSKISKGKVTKSQGFFQIHSQEELNVVGLSTAMVQPFSFLSF